METLFSSFSEYLDVCCHSLKVINVIKYFQWALQFNNAANLFKTMMPCIKIFRPCDNSCWWWLVRSGSKWQLGVWWSSLNSRFQSFFFAVNKCSFDICDCFISLSSAVNLVGREERLLPMKENLLDGAKREREERGREAALRWAAGLEYRHFIIADFFSTISLFGP